MKTSLARAAHLSFRQRLNAGFTVELTLDTRNTKCHDFVVHPIGLCNSETRILRLKKYRMHGAENSRLCAVVKEKIHIRISLPMLKLLERQ